MLTFAAPILLAVPAGLALLGAVALFRGQRRARIVSSLRLWAQPATALASAKRRRIDPVWLLVYLGAVAAALVLAGPRWEIRAENQPWAALEVSVQSLTKFPASGTTEAFVRWRNGQTPGEEKFELLADGHIAATPTLDQLRAGITLPLNVKSDRVVLVLQTTDTHQPLAQLTFDRSPLDAPFGVFELPGSTPDQAIDPALRRLLAVQGGARFSDPTVKPAVVLLDDPKSSSDCAALAGDSGLVIAGPESQPPGIEPGETRTLPAPGAKPGPVNIVESLPFPVYAPFDHVHVSRYRMAKLSSEWTVLQLTDGNPWIATRQVKDLASGKEATWLWLASQPTRDTDWPRDPSFVLFFGQIAETILAGPLSPGADGKIIPWHAVENETLNGPPTPATTQTPLDRYLGVMALVLWLTAIGMLMHRSQ